MIRDEIRKFIVEKFLFSCGDQLDDEASLLETNTVDSIGILEIVSFIENRFNLKVEDEELTAENLDSVSKISRFVEKKLGLQG